MANPWFRLYSEFAHDPKIQRLSELDQRRFVMLLCLRCGNDNVTLQDEDVTFQLRISNNDWLVTKRVLMEKNLINNDNLPVAWEKRQFVSDTSAPRVAKHRAKKKAERNVTVTPQIQNRTDTDTDTYIKPSASNNKIVFDGSSFQNITGQLAVWEKAYPAINIQNELNKAAAWLVANPQNKKSQYGRFINSWLSKAQDKAPAKGNSSNAPAKSFLERDGEARQRGLEKFRNRSVAQTNIFEGEFIENHSS